MLTYKTLLGLPFLIGNLQTVSNKLIQMADQRRGCTIIPASLNDIASSLDHKYMLDYQKIDHFTTDGMPLVWWARISGFKKAHRVYGPDLFLYLLEKSQKKGFTHAFYGGNSNSLRNLIKIISDKFSIDVVYTYAPKFSEDLSNDFTQLKEIQKTNPHFLWIGLGGKKQVQLMAAWKSLLPNTVIAGVGAAFDFVSKNKPQAPQSMQRAGLEWLFRLYTEPQRLWKRYIIVIPFGLLQYFFNYLYGKIFSKK